jgi:phage shock protein A
MSSGSAAGFLVIAAVCFSVGATAQPQRPVPYDPDLAELAAYRLTSATLQKVTIATQAFAQALRSDPQYKDYVAAQDELKALQAKENPTPAEERRIEAIERRIEQMSDAMSGGGDARTLADMERKITAMPHMAEALAKAGLSPREYAKFNLTVIQAGFLADMKMAGQLRQVPPGVSMENVQFVIDHEKEIAALSDQMAGR